MTRLVFAFVRGASSQAPERRSALPQRGVARRGAGRGGAGRRATVRGALRAHGCIHTLADARAIARAVLLPEREGEEGRAAARQRATQAGDVSLQTQQEHDAASPLVDLP